MAGRLSHLFLSALLLAGLSCLSGCSSLFFYPDHRHYLAPNDLGLSYTDVHLTTSDGTHLNAWWLPAQGASQGTIYYLHGNAQNMGAFLINIGWLPKAHYNVFMIDYRGFGRSSGSPDLDGALNDAEAGLRWVYRHQDKPPIFLLGQSLGAALTLDLAGHWRDFGTEPAGVIADGAFTGFRRIAREKLDQFWLTWPLQYPLSWTIPADNEPIDNIARISPVPLMLISSHRDTIVPFHHGVQLFAKAGEPKRFLATETPHTATFLVPQYRRELLAFLHEYGARTRHSGTTVSSTK